MASFPRNCPDCGARLKSDLPRKNGKIRCPECKESIAPEQDDEEDAGVQSKPGRVPANRGRRYHDEESPRPIRNNNQSSSGTLIVVGIVFAGFVLLLLGGGALGFYLYSSRSAPAVAQAPPVPVPVEAGRVDKPIIEPVKGDPAGVNPPVKPGQPQEPPKEPIKPAVPADGGPAPNLGEFPLEKLKEASVYIKMHSGTTGATGSGFVIRSQGDTVYVVTNHHVVTPKADAPGRPGRPPFTRPQPVELTAVFRSGTEEEQSAKAQLVADDKDADLAVLKVTGVKNSPQPIDYAQSPKLVETMPVKAFGFPFGENLDPKKKNPAITVTTGDVSSLRMDGGSLSEVQLNLDLNPGNSGGPIVDGKGSLVGVAVAHVVNTRIGIAVPVHKLKRFLEGEVHAPSSLRVDTVQGQTQVRVLAHASDAMGNLRSATLLYGFPNEVKIPVKGKNGWERLIGAKSVEFTVQGTAAVAVLPIAPPQGEFKIVVQSSYQNGAGETIYTEPRTMSMGGQPPVNPVNPVNPVDPGKPPVATGPATGEDLTKLLADLKSNDEPARQKAAEAVRQFPPRERLDEVKKALDGLLTSTDPATRTAGARAVAACDPKEAAPALVKLLEDDTPAVRQAVLRIMQERKDPRVITAVAARLPADGAPAAGALKAIGPAAEKAVLPFLKDANPLARFWAFQVIEEIGAVDSVAPLEAIAASNTPDAGHARGALTAIRQRLPVTKDEWPQILEDLKSADSPVRAAATRRIAMTPPIDARRADLLSRLESLLNDQDGNVRVAAVKALGRWGDKATIPLLIKRLEGADRSLHAPVMEVLAEKKDEAVAIAIAKRLPDVFDRGAATQALKAMDQPIAEKAVLSLLTDSNVFVRTEACKILVDIGGRDSIGPLEQLAGENNVFYSGQAKLALTAIKARTDMEKK